MKYKVPAASIFSAATNPTENLVCSFLEQLYEDISLMFLPAATVCESGTKVFTDCRYPDMSLSRDMIGH